MNNEPVAWTKKDTLTYLNNYQFGSITIQVQKAKDDEFDIPLYTNPHPDDLERAETIIKLLQLKIANLENENAFIKNNLCTPLLGSMIHGYTPKDVKALQTKPLTDEEIDLVRTVLDGCVCSIKTEIEQE